MLIAEERTANTAPPNRRALAIARLIVAFVAVFAAYGIFSLLSNIWQHLGPIVAQSGIAPAATHFGRSMVAGFGDHGSEWISAVSAIAVSVATVALWRSTDALSRSTNLQQTTDGPFLTVVLYQEGTSPAPTLTNGTPVLFGEYDSGYLRQDNESNLTPFLGTGEPQYVDLIVVNRASKPSSVAADIRIKTLMFFGGTAPNHPFSISRDYTISLVQPQMLEAIRLYNVAGLKSYQIQIREVIYTDMMGRDRRAATGLGMITLNDPGPAVSVVKLYKPRKGEFTDAIDD